MIVRSEQTKILEDAGKASFEGEMVDHLARYAPRLYELRGPAVFGSVVRGGHRKANELGFERRGPVRLILEMMVAFGCDFDTDPQLPAFSSALADPGPQHEMDRAERVYEAVLKYRSEVVGEDGKLAIQALEQVRRIASAAPPSNAERLLEALQNAYPARFNHAGRSAMARLVERAAAEAQKRSVPTSAGVTLFAALMFALGHGAFGDPLYPWIASALEDTQLPGPDQQVARLRDRAIVYLDRVSTHWKAVHAG